MPLKLLLFVLTALSLSAAEPAATAKCVFCDIVAGRTAQSGTICYRDDTVVAFMNHAPRNPGHLLIVPVRHTVDFLSAPAETVAHMHTVAQLLAAAIRRTDLKAEGFNFQSNTGKAAGQSVFHLHLHVIPRFTGEPASPTAESRPVLPIADLEAVAQKIRTALAEAPKTE